MDYKRQLEFVEEHIVQQNEDHLNLLGSMKFQILELRSGIAKCLEEIDKINNENQ